MGFWTQLYYYVPALEAVRDFFELGGMVLVVIAALMLCMWLLIFERVMYLWFRHPQLCRQALALWQARQERSSWQALRIREMLISTTSQQLEKRVHLIHTCIILFPLLGILGTVTGMVQVFEVVAISGAGNPRSMAAGVSMATVPTMAGMVAALSGLAVSAWLQSRTANERELLGERMVFGIADNEMPA
ncbi:MAG: MotA/TolQ/ExbB proton channel family protein [Candidatus Porifericomitaceae bacterium WSBS_2022_MAG_OTU9]